MSKGIVAAITAGVAGLLLLLALVDRQDMAARSHEARHAADRAEFDLDFARATQSSPERIRKLEGAAVLAQEQLGRVEALRTERDGRQQRALDVLQNAAAQEFDKQASSPTISEELEQRRGTRPPK